MEEKGDESEWIWLQWSRVWVMSDGFDDDINGDEERWWWEKFSLLSDEENGK